MMYAEAAYFDRHPCKHVADWQDWKRVQRLQAAARTAWLRTGR